MSYKIRLYYSTGKTLYGLVRNPDGKYWSTAAQSFTGFSGVHADFDVPLTEDSTRTGLYEGNIGINPTAGTYYDDIWKQTNVSGPSATNDIRIGGQEHPWVWNRDFSHRHLSYYEKPAELQYSGVLTQGGTAVPTAYVWFSPSLAGDVALQSDVTDGSGQYSVQLQPGTVYLHASKTDRTFGNLPTALTVPNFSRNTGPFKVQMMVNRSISGYALVFDEDGDCWNGNAFNNFDGDHTTYAIPLVEHNTQTGYYRATAASTAAGLYEIEYWRQDGATAARGADELLGVSETLWAGKFEIDKSRLQPGVSGIGTVRHVYSVTDAEGNPASNVIVRCTLDAAGQKVVSVATTNQYGNATFFIPAGSYYFWPELPGINYQVPDKEVVS